MDSAIGWLLKFYILATSKVIPEWLVICDSAHSWRHYSAASMGDQAASTMTRYPTGHIILTLSQPALCHILIMLRA